jgi:SAM-dependent methyltransferase
MRYEGTAQRELFRQLRERFLLRNARSGRWALDVGSGPGRFSRHVGAGGVTCVGLDLSLAMLAVGREISSPAAGPEALRVERVRGDALQPPFSPGTFDEVALVGNALGFEAGSGDALLQTVEGLVAEGGFLLVEVAPGPGEHARYLARLPHGAVRRLLAAPPAAVLPRVRREGFETEPIRHRTAAFRRWTADELLERWRPLGWRVREAMAVAPALGPDPGRLSEVARDPQAWARLMEMEEQLGREPDRWPNAAAILVAVERPTSPTHEPVPVSSGVLEGRFTAA